MTKQEYLRRNKRLMWWLFAYILATGVINGIAVDFWGLDKDIAHIISGALGIPIGVAGFRMIRDARRLGIQSGGLIGWWKRRRSGERR